jgi:hypothetical protein
MTITAATCKQKIVDYIKANPTAVERAYDSSLNYGDLACNCGRSGEQVRHNPYEHLFCYDTRTWIEYRLQSRADLLKVVLKKSDWKSYGKSKSYYTRGAIDWCFDHAGFDSSLRAYVRVKDEQILAVRIMGE